MASKVHEFNVGMTCEGCSGAVRRVLENRAEIENVEIDLEAKKVFVKSTLSSDEVLEYIKKTGKSTTFIGTRS